MYCNQIMALMDAFKEKIQSWVSPLFPFFFFFIWLFPSRQSVSSSSLWGRHGGSDRTEMSLLGRSKGQEATDSIWLCYDNNTALKPPTPTHPSPFADIIQGRVWVAVKNDHHPRSPNHRRGQSPSNKSGTSSKVIIDKGWHANVDTGEIILWGQWLHISCFQRGRRCLMYKYCGGTLFPYLLRDYKRSRVETIRDAGSHVSFL